MTIFLLVTSPVWYPVWFLFADASRLPRVWWRVYVVGCVFSGLWCALAITWILRECHTFPMINKANGRARGMRLW
jgi:hypothetical protein